MRPSRVVEEITIKVPSPFEGVADLGFSARYPEQSIFAPLRDVPIWIEGPSEPIRRLSHRLRMMAGLEREAHGWTDPIMLTDGVVIMAFRDRSLEAELVSDGARSSVDYVLNLVRPVVFPFLKDCAQVAHLRLSQRIEMTVHGGNREIAGLQMGLEQIVQPNGEDLLSA